MRASPLSFLFGALVCGVSAGPLVKRVETVDATNTSVAYSICQNNDTFATTEGRLFNYNGTGTKYFAGTNTWYLSHLLEDSDVETAFSQIKDTQLQVTRVWGFGSVNTDPGVDTVFFQLLNSTGSYINYATANGLPRLDAVVHYAEQYGVKLVLNFVNNWSDLGGIASYTEAFGGNATSWFTDEQSQTVYKEYVELLVNRYKCSSAIFAWELANEPRCTGCDTSVISDWATDISKYIKSLDANHMVTLGDEGWFAPDDDVGDGSYDYSGDLGVDFVKNLGIETLDYGTFHLYPDSWGHNDSWGNTWILEHNAAGAAAGKPVVLEEYGAGTTGNHSAEEPWQITVLEDTEIAMDQFWQWATTTSSTIESECDDLCIFYDDAEYQILAMDHAAAMLDKAVSTNATASATSSVATASSVAATTSVAATSSVVVSATSVNLTTSVAPTTSMAATTSVTSVIMVTSMPLTTAPLTTAPLTTVPLMTAASSSVSAGSTGLVIPTLAASAPFPQNSSSSDTGHHHFFHHPHHGHHDDMELKYNP